MANSPLLSIVALYTYDNEILNNIEPYLPTTVSNPEISITPIPIDFDTLKDNLLFELGELTVFYSDPVFLKEAIKAWAAKQSLVWQRMFDTLFYHYNPLFNKIREYELNRNDSNARTVSETESEADTKNRAQNDTQNRDIDRTDTGNNSGTTAGSITHSGSGSGTEDVDTKNYKQAYNDIGVDQWAQDTRSVVDRDVTSTDSYTDSTGGSTSATSSMVRDETDVQTLARMVADTINKSRNKSGSTLDSGTLNDTIIETITGQIPFQELITLQRNIAMYNLYDIIIQQFKERFCVLIY